MSWFQLDAENVCARVRSSGETAELPTRGAFLLRGIIGFTLVSVAGFLPWAVFGKWFYRHIGEAGLYSVCATSFIGLAGLLLHKLILGPGSLVRFYKLFSISFTAYSIAWIVGWMTLRGHPGSIVGLLAGAAVMGFILTRAFGAPEETLKVIAVIFILNATGYFLGGLIEGAAAQMEPTILPEKIQMMIAKLLWGVCYGIGLGAGLGIAFYLCQKRTRERLARTA